MKYLLSIMLIIGLSVSAFALSAEDGDKTNWGVAAIRSDGDFDTDGDVVLSGDITAGFDATISTESEITASTSDLGAYQKVVITIADYEMTVSTNASAANAEGAVKLIDFPEGYLQVTGILCDLEVTNSETGVAADSTYDVGFGATETDGVGGELDTSTDYDFLGKIEGDLSSYEADIESQSITDTGVDGTTTAVDMWLNYSLLDADVTAPSTATWSGTITVFYNILGDY